MRLGRRKASVLCGVTAALAMAFGFTGVAAVTVTTGSAQVQSSGDDGGVACGVTNAEYAIAPPDCTTGGSGTLD